MNQLHQKEFEGICRKVRTEQTDQVKAHVRNIFSRCMQPQARDDWRAIDLVMAAINVQLQKVYDETIDLLIKTALINLDEAMKMSDKIYYAQTWKLALSLIVLTHSRFVIDGVYRDGNADWYFDRLCSAIEGTISQTQEERDKEVEKALAKIRSFDRQTTVKGRSDSKGREGGKGPEGGAQETGEQGAQGV